MAITADQIACIVLAAGRSRRFSGSDKLAAVLDAKPLLHHALAPLASFGFSRKLVVCRRDAPQVGAFGFERLEFDDPDALQSDSLRCGLEAIDSTGLAAVLVALGDMPSVTADHIQRLLDRFDGADPLCVVASTAAGARMPPALFAIAHYDALRAADGDRGARALLAIADLVETDCDELADIDTPADLARVSQARHG